MQKIDGWIITRYSNGRLRRIHSSSYNCELLHFDNAGRIKYHYIHEYRTGKMLSNLKYLSPNRQLAEMIIHNAHPVPSHLIYSCLP